MKRKTNLLRHILLWTALMASTLVTWAQTATVLTEDFSGTTNIFGVTATGLATGSACIYDTKLDGFGPVLAVSNATATGTINSSDGKAVSASIGKVTVEFDAFHGYYAYDATTTVSLLNSDGQAIASYTYNANGWTGARVTAGGQEIAGFEAFSLQSTGANGWAGSGKPYSATTNPHISISLSATGKMEMAFTLNGNTTNLLGSALTMAKDVAAIQLVNKFSRGENTDRCYGIDNIKVTTEVIQQDPDQVEDIAFVVINGADNMTFGPSTDTPYANSYSVTITGTEGTTITEDNINPKVTDFNVVWDIDGFKTQNDTEGQYCDSYGSFSTNNAGKVQTTFDLRDVPMNFFGKMTATITYNGTTTVAEKYVVAQGDLSTGAGQVLPRAGFPASLSAYPNALVGYKVADETYGNASDPLLGGWCVAGSDTHNGVLMADADNTKYIRLTASTLKKSHVMTQKIDSPSGQIVFTTLLRFNQAGASVTLTGGYPFWSSSKYTCPVSLNFDGSKLTLNGTALTSGETEAQFTTGTWYRVVLSADKSSQITYAKVFSTTGQLIGETAMLPWAEESSPTFFSIGMGNSNTGSVDMAQYEAVIPTPSADTFTLTADKQTLSIPQGETARLMASVNSIDGMPITQTANWSIVESDMEQAVIITPDATDSHSATITLSPTAEAGTATIQVSIGGIAKTIALSLTSSAESIKFTESTTSITIPLDEAETVTATFAAQLISGDGTPVNKPVTLAAYDKAGLQPYTFADGITFDASTGLLTVSAAADPATFTIRATANNSDGEELTKSVTVSVHGMKFDFGLTDDEAVAEGFTAVGATTAYSDANGYGLASGTATSGGTASATDAGGDYLEGALQFNFKVQKGNFYTVEVTCQGVLTTAHINSDLAGYELSSNSSMTTATYTIPATRDFIDLHIANVDATSVARIAKVVVTKQPMRQKNKKIKVRHIGDSTSANNGSWAYRLSKNPGSYPELFNICEFINNGAGGRNLSTYYTQGKLAYVLNEICPGDVVMFGNMGTNGMGSSFEADVNYYLDAAEALGAKVILNSYTPHGAVSNYTSGYNSTTNTFDSYRRDSYDNIVRKIDTKRAANDDNYLGFVEIGKNADAIFNAYVADYAANGYASADAAAQAIIACFPDHNHYNNNTLACDLMLNGYKTATVKGIVPQIVDLIKPIATGIDESPMMGNSTKQGDEAVYTLSGQRVDASQQKPGLYIKGGRKVIIR